MTLDEAIKHCKEVAERECSECGEEHRILASWLTELQLRREADMIVSEDYERGFKDGLKSECLEELKPLMAKLIEGCTEAIKGITPMLIDKAHLTIKHAVNRWIPCSERLPETIEPVIFSVERGYKQVCCGYRYGKHRMWRDRISGLHYTDYDVIAWMPMPDAYEPPKEGESDA